MIFTQLYVVGISTISLSADCNEKQADKAEYSTCTYSLLATTHILHSQLDLKYFWFNKNFEIFGNKNSNTLPFCWNYSNLNVNDITTYVLFWPGIVTISFFILKLEVLLIPICVTTYNRHSAYHSMPKTELVL